MEDHKDEYLWHETMTTPTIPRGQCDTPCRIWPVPTFVIQDLTQWQCSARGSGQHEVFPSSVPCQHLYLPSHSSRTKKEEMSGPRGNQETDNLSIKSNFEFT